MKKQRMKHKNANADVSKAAMERHTRLGDDHAHAAKTGGTVSEHAMRYQNPTPGKSKGQGGHKEAIAKHVERLNTLAARNAPNDLHAGAKFSVEHGPKFSRIVREKGGARSAHHFVENATGKIWKAASWKGPAKNFPRGSIHVGEEGKGGSGDWDESKHPRDESGKFS
jgi:hypothetical protein